MVDKRRRGLLKGIAGIIAAGSAPAFISADVLMPARNIIMPEKKEILTAEMLVKEKMEAINEEFTMKDLLALRDKMIALDIPPNAQGEYEFQVPAKFAKNFKKDMQVYGGDVRFVDTVPSGIPVHDITGKLISGSYENSKYNGDPFSDKRDVSWAEDCEILDRIHNHTKQNKAAISHRVAKLRESMGVNPGTTFEGDGLKISGKNDMAQADNRKRDYSAERRELLRGRDV